jgi:hypothetical protein
MHVLENSGYSVAPVSLGPFDVCGVGPYDVLLCRVAFGAWPAEDALDEMTRFPAPLSVQKVVYRWRPGADLPDVKVIGKQKPKAKRRLMAA